MLQTISWNSYLSWVALLTGCYYLFVILFYYRNDLNNFFKSSKGRFEADNDLPNNEHHEDKEV